MDMQVAVEKSSGKTQVQLEIIRDPDDLSQFKIFIKAPLLASIVEKMTPGVYPKAEYHEVYGPILELAEGYKDKVVSRPAIYGATNYFVKGSDFSFLEKPRGVLLANPKALREGFTLTYKPKDPIPLEDLKKWGANVMKGCEEILNNTRPFKMVWFMNETTEPNK
jgi:hypothetical protein